VYLHFHLFWNLQIVGFRQSLPWPLLAMALEWCWILVTQASMDFSGGHWMQRYAKIDRHSRDGALSVAESAKSRGMMNDMHAVPQDTFLRILPGSSNRHVQNVQCLIGICVVSEIRNGFNICSIIFAGNQVFVLPGQTLKLFEASFFEVGNPMPMFFIGSPLSSYPIMMATGR